MTARKVTLLIKATRHKSGTWQVRVEHPDGSWETHSALVDAGHAAGVIDRVLRKVEEPS